MKALLLEDQYQFISQLNKDFIVAVDSEMEKRGFTAGGTISPGYCWGKYMIIYTKKGVKSKKSYVRIYIREKDIVLRLYLTGIDKHRQVIEQSPGKIREAFTGSFPTCEHCDGKINCIHQKRYTLNNISYEICDGKAFYFTEPDFQYLQDYFKLFDTFYPNKNIKK